MKKLGLITLLAVSISLLASCFTPTPIISGGPTAMPAAIATKPSIKPTSGKNTLLPNGTIQINVYVNETKMDVAVYKNNDSPQSQGPDNLGDYVLAQPILDFLGATSTVNADAGTVTFSSQKYGEYSFGFTYTSGPYTFSNAKMTDDKLYVAFHMFRVYTDGSLVQDDYDSMYLYTGDYERTDIPKTLEESYVKLDEILDTKDKAFIKNATDAELAGLHFGLGLWIRNNWLYPTQSHLTKSLSDSGLQSIDDVSSIILRGYKLYLNGKPCSINDLLNNSEE